MKQHILPVACCLAMSATACGDLITQSILASADGDVQWSGSAGGYTVDAASGTMRIQRSGGNNVRNAIAEFDLGLLPNGAQLTSATLRLMTAGLVSNTSPTAPVHVYAFVGDGVITSDDHQNETAGMWMASLSLPTGSGTPIGTVLNIDLGDIASLQSILDDGKEFLALRLQTENFVTVTFHTLETNNEAAIRPTLELSYTMLPAPAAGVLLFGLLGCRNRRRS